MTAPKELKIGDRVRIKDGRTKYWEYPGWVNHMDETIGKYGKVISIEKQQDDSTGYKVQLVNEPDTIWLYKRSWLVHAPYKRHSNNQSLASTYNWMIFRVKGITIRPFYFYGKIPYTLNKAILKFEKARDNVLSILQEPATRQDFMKLNRKEQKK